MILKIFVPVASRLRVIRLEQQMCAQGLHAQFNNNMLRVQMKETFKRFVCAPHVCATMCMTHVCVGAACMGATCVAAFTSQKRVSDHVELEQ